jgi:GntR family transcriptional regulator, transcriptional repressor for pyruvate dehydrogenase complex
MVEITGQYFQGFDKSRLSDEIAKHLEQLIREGRLLPGQRLPSERELSEQLQVSRPVLREALRALEIKGVVSIHRGSGVFVKKVAEDILEVNLRVWLSENIHLIRAFYESRLTIEPECAALASQRATDKQIQNLKAILQDTQIPVQKQHVRAFIGMDIDFHAAIADMSGNAFFSKMLSSIISTETDMRGIVLQMPDHFEIANRGHEAIVKAIEARNPEQARQAMISALQDALDAIDVYLASEKKS